MKVFITSAIISILYLGTMCAINIQPASLNEASLRATAMATGQYFDPIITEILYVTPFATLTPTAIAVNAPPATDEPTSESSTDGSPAIAQLPTQPLPTLAPTILPTATAIPPTAAPTPTSIPATATSVPTSVPEERLPTFPPPNTDTPPDDISNDDDDNDDSEGGQPNPGPTPDKPTPIPNVPNVAFTQPTFQVTESEANKLITVKLEGTINQPVAVSYAIIEETATETFDYQAVTGQLTFTPNQNQATFSVPIIDDNTDDPITETARLILTNGTTPVNFTRQTATLEITDNDSPPTLQFSQAAFSVTENQPSLLTVTLSHPSGQFVSVGYSLFNQPAAQSATPTEDFQDFSFGLLNFGPDNTGNSPTTITFTWSSLVDDQIVELDERLNFKLKPPFNATLGQLTTTTLTILDNDGGK